LIGSNNGTVFVLTSFGRLSWQQHVGGSITGGGTVTNDGTLFLTGSSTGHVHALNLVGVTATTSTTPAITVTPATTVAPAPGNNIVGVLAGVVAGVLVVAAAVAVFVWRHRKAAERQQRQQPLLDSGDQHDLDS
jgi:outer membrane protein assembly factor BamB